MAISMEDKRAIDAAVEKLHYVHTGPAGEKYIEIFADYRENNESLLQPAYDNRRLGFEDKDNPQNALADFLRETIDGWYMEYTWEMESQILREAGFEPFEDSSEEQLEYLRDTYPIVPDYDHFLDEGVKVNLMIKCADESNRDFIGIYDQFQAMVADDWTQQERDDALAEECGLSWLVKQQGHTMQEVKSTWKEYIAFFDSEEAKDLSYQEKYDTFRAAHNPFLTSVCQELGNMVNYMNTMTVLTEISLSDYADFMQPGKEIVIPKDAMIGIFNPWNGGGSTLDIELEKELVLPSELIFDVQIEGAKPAHGYTVDNVYGLVGSAWKKATQVREANSGKDAKAPSLDSLIQSASQRAGAAAQQQDKAITNPEQGRD